MKFWCTINTDASYHPKHEVGAFAFYIVHDQGKIIQSGALKQCTSALDAEIQSIGNALYALLKSDFANIHYIRINTDCTYAIDAIRDRKYRNANKQRVKYIHEIIDGLIKKYKKPLKRRKYPFIDYRYVPAHTDTSTPAKWVNDWADKAAKRMLWEKINQQNNNNDRQSTTMA